MRKGIAASTVDLATLTTVIKDSNDAIVGSPYTQTFEAGVKRFEIRGIDSYVPFSKIQ